MLKEFDLINPPSIWQKSIFYNFFSHDDKQKTGLYKTAANGDVRIQWRKESILRGDYDIYFYIPDFSRQLEILEQLPGTNNKKTFSDFHFIIYHDNGIDEKKLDVNKLKSGWAFLGTYKISNEAKVELLDISKGKLIFADAVKWVNN